MSTFEMLLRNGGFTAWLSLSAAVILIIVSVERFFFLYLRYSYRVSGAVENVRKAVLKREYTQALQVCNVKEQAPELKVIKSGLIAVEHGREAMRSALGGAVHEVSRKVAQRMSIIALIAAVATLLGLLGTITGLIKTFSAIAEADPAKKGELLGVGISEAMYSTAFGLIVGIVAMVAHTIFTSKGDGIVGASQDAGYKLVTWVEESERAK